MNAFTWSEWVLAIEAGLVLALLVYVYVPLPELFRWQAFKAGNGRVEFFGVQWGLVHIGKFRFKRHASDLHWEERARELADAVVNPDAQTLARNIATAILYGDDFYSHAVDCGARRGGGCTCAAGTRRK